MPQVKAVTVNNTGADGFEVIDPETGAKYATLKDINEAFDYCGDTGRVVVGFRGDPFGKDGIDPFILIRMFDYAAKQMMPSKSLLKLFADISKEIYLKESTEHLLKTALSEYKKNNQTKEEKNK